MQIKAGVDGIVPVGTTGESPTVDYEEHIKIIALSVKFARGKIKVLAGTGANSTSEAIYLTQRRRKGRRGRLAAGRAVLQQADAGRLVPALPRDRAHDATAHRALQHSGPLRHRNRRGNRPAPGARMQEHHRHQGSRRQLRPRVASCARRWARNLRFCQRRRFADAAVHGGGRAGRHQRGLECHSAPGRADGERLCRAADAESALQLHQKFYPLFKDLFIETNPVPVKAALAMMGADRGRISPAAGADERGEPREMLRATMKACGVLK